MALEMPRPDNQGSIHPKRSAKKQAEVRCGNVASEKRIFFFINFELKSLFL